MISSISPFLAFTGSANAALDLYAQTFEGAQIERKVLYGPEEDGPAGTVRLGVLRIGELRLRAIDVPENPAFQMSPAFSVYVECGEADDVDAYAHAIGDGGAVLMPVEKYDFAERFAWVADRFGVNWQFVHNATGIAAET